MGEQSFRCLDDARTGAGGSLGLTGEIAPDASFTLLTPNSRNTLQVTVTGKMPDVGASTWKGTCRLTGLTRPNCDLNQEGSFTAQPLPALTGRFIGPITMSYYEAPATAYKGPTYAHLSFTVNYAQGKLLIHSRRLGASIAYLPLAAEIHVKGSPCFAHGSTVAGDLYNAIAGNMATVRFTMDDGSELSLNTVYTSPTGRELLIQVGGVHGGLCDHQLFAGTLTNH